MLGFVRALSICSSMPFERPLRSASVASVQRLRSRAARTVAARAVERVFGDGACLRAAYGGAFRQTLTHNRENAKMQECKNADE